jgi:hypothetical protein
MVYSAVSLENDIQTISLIAQKSIDVKTFDYEGVRYKRKQANELVTKLKPELEQLNDEIKRWDYQIYAYFLDREKSKGCPQLYFIFYFH